MPPSGSKGLPEANEFSPGQIKLREVLGLATAYAGDRLGLVEALRLRYFAQSASKQANAEKRLRVQRTRANNVLIGMKGYRLFDLETSRPTPAGDQLVDIEDDRDLADAFAVHILRNCNGMEVLEAVRAVHARGLSATKSRLQTELEGRGFSLPRGTTHHTKMLQWLREAAVVDKANRIDDSRIADLMGIDLTTLEGWEALDQPQKALLLTLRRLTELHPDESLHARDVVTQAKFEHGSIFREDQLAAQVFRPLEETGWIFRDVETSGRGGKSGRLKATPKLSTLDPELLPKDDGWGIPSQLRPRLNTPLATIYEDLKSEDKNLKGIALELLALRLATDAGLTPLRFRLRAAETGGAEVDLIAEGAHLHFSRWLFQCKNTKTVTLADLAKEIGMATLLRAHVVCLVTTGRFADTVRTHARELMATTPLQVVLADTVVLASYRKQGLSALMMCLHEGALETMRLKRSQISRERENK